MLTDAVLIMMYAALAVPIVVITVSPSLHIERQKLVRPFWGISACMFGWFFVTFAYHIATKPKLLEYLDNLTFVFMAFLPVMLLVFILRFYRNRRNIRPEAMLLLCIIPIVTAVIAIVPPFNWLLRTDYVVLQISPLHMANYEWNLWFYVHTIYSYLLMVVSGFLVIRQYKSQPAEYKLPSALLIASLLVTTLIDLPVLHLPASFTVVDNTLIGVCASVVLVYFAILNNPAFEFISFARKALYNNLDMSVFILDKQDFVLDMNKSAQKLLETLGREIDSAPLAFPEIYEAISAYGGTFKSDILGENMSRIQIRVNGENLMLRQVRRELTDSKKRFRGSYIAMIDITKWSQMVEDLQSKAVVDPLTGIPNRRAYEQRLGELDVPENLPFSVIVGDVNHLKRVNDTMGHKYGDMLIQTVAGFFSEACPESGFPARIGGDEFIMLLPGFDAQAAQAVMDDIQRRLADERKQFLDASIALGHTVKTEPEQDIRERIHQADQLMYSQKKYDRRRGS